MLEPIYKLIYKANAGIADAKAELASRKSGRVELPLIGLHGETLCLTALPELTQQARTLYTLYDKVPRNRKTKDVILLDAYSSATIEGARTTVAHVRACFDKPDSKDARMVINTVNGSNYAYRHPITGDNIRTLWEIVVQDVCENADCAGTLYRDGMVYVGNTRNVIHTPAKPEQIQPMMDSGFAFLQDSTLDRLIRFFVFHFYFVYTHPFCDGNGRVARIMNASNLYFSGLKKMPWLPLSSAINGNLDRYYGTLADSERAYPATASGQWLDLSPFVSYMLDMFEQCLISSALAENSLSEHESTILTRMSKVGRGAELTAKKAAGMLHRSDSTARKVLNNLVQKGYLEVFRNGSRNIYKLSPNAHAEELDIE